MPTLKTKSGDEIYVPSRLVARLAERMFRMGPEKRENYLDKARKRVGAGDPSRNAVATVLAAGG